MILALKGNVSDKLDNILKTNNTDIVLPYNHATVGKLQFQLHLKCSSIFIASKGAPRSKKKDLWSILC